MQEGNVIMIDWFIYISFELNKHNTRKMKQEQMCKRRREKYSREKLFLIKKDCIIFISHQCFACLKIVSARRKADLLLWRNSNLFTHSQKYEIIIILVINRAREKGRTEKERKENRERGM